MKDYPQINNAWQRERAAAAGILPNTIDNARTEMVRAGELPVGLNKHTVSEWQDAAYTYLSYFNATDNQWMWQRTNKATKEKISLSAHTLDGVGGLKLKIVELMGDEMLDAQPSAVTFKKWEQTSRWGKIFYTIDTPTTRTLLLEQLAENGDDVVSYDSLERAWLALYDSVPSPLDPFLEQAQQPTQPAVFTPVGNPNLNLRGNTAEQQLRSEQAAAATKLSTKELKQQIFREGGWKGRTQ